MISKDKIVSKSDIYETTNYQQFKTLKGNRTVDKVHVKQLVNKINKEGSLLPDFPILVNEKMEILDGQHRLAAAEQLKYPIFYEIKEGLNISSVTSLNTGMKNWNWSNYAHRYAAFDNINYIQFLELEKEFKINFRILLTYSFANSAKANPLKHPFYLGDFVMKNFELTKKLLKQYQELAIMADTRSQEFAYAVFKFIRTPSYKHDVMLTKVEQYGEKLKNCYIVSDYLIELENIWRA